MSALNLTLGFNVVTFAVVIMALIVVYLVILLVQNMFINMTPKAIGRFIMFVFLLGSLWPWIIIGNSLMIYLVGGLTLLFLFYFFWRQARTSKRNRAAQLNNANQ